LGGVRIPGVAFADDVVLVTSHNRGPLRQVGTVIKYGSKRGLGMQFKKTKIMRCGRGRHEHTTWKVVMFNEKGVKITQEIDEVNVYKYGGLLVGNGRTWEQHLITKLREAVWRVKKLKAVVGEGENEAWLTNAGWRAIVRPALLYGVEVVPYPSYWVNKLEVAQKKLARWVIGVDADSSSSGVLGEVGWGTIKVIIAKRKVMFWERIKEMERGRWPREALQHILEANYESDLWRSVMDARDVLGLEGVVEGMSKSAVKSLACRVDEERWRLSVREDERLEIYPKVSLIGASEYVGRSRVRATMAKFRLGAVGMKWGVKVKNVCEKCGSVLERINIHILVCEGLRSEGWGPQLGPDINMSCQKILGDTSWFNMLKVYKRFREWSEDFQG